MLNNQQIKLVQTAVRSAAIRTPHQDGRYRLLLGQYKQSSGKPVNSCKQLTRAQMDDLLAICESLGWRHPAKGENFYRKKIEREVYHGGTSVAQAETIKLLAGDLGMTKENLKVFVLRMTSHRVDSLLLASQSESWKITEALKAMLSRRDGVDYKTVADVAAAYG